MRVMTEEYDAFYMVGYLGATAEGAIKLIDQGAAMDARKLLADALEKSNRGVRAPEPNGRGAK